jgi:hypothetical protein
MKAFSASASAPSNGREFGDLDQPFAAKVLCVIFVADFGKAVREPLARQHATDL